MKKTPESSSLVKLQESLRSLVENVSIRCRGLVNSLVTPVVSGENKATREWREKTREQEKSRRKSIKSILAGGVPEAVNDFRVGTTADSASHTEYITILPLGGKQKPARPVDPDANLPVLTEIVTENDSDKIEPSLPQRLKEILGEEKFSLVGKSTKTLAIAVAAFVASICGNVYYHVSLDKKEAELSFAVKKADEMEKKADVMEKKAKLATSEVDGLKLTIQTLESKNRVEVERSDGLILTLQKTNVMAEKSVSIANVCLRAEIELMKKTYPTKEPQGVSLKVDTKLSTKRVSPKLSVGLVIKENPKGEVNFLATARAINVDLSHAGNRITYNTDKKTGMKIVKFSNISLGRVALVKVPAEVDMTRFMKWVNSMMIWTGEEEAIQAGALKSHTTKKPRY